MKLNLKFDPNVILPQLKRAQPYVLGIALIAIFGYTALVVNAALNVPPQDPTASASAIKFDPTAIQTVKNLNVVSGTVSNDTGGKSNPFVQ